MDKLKHILSQEDTILFIGSGVSLWSGLPSWSGMIEELAQFIETQGASASLVRSEAKRGELLQAASFGFDKLTKPQIGDFIRSACRYGVARPHEIHRKIVTLGARCYITTNYDNLLEEALRQWQPSRFFRPPITNRHLTETAEIVHARSIDFIFKPHGDAADSESIILTREQYRQLLPQGERRNALESLKMLLASRPIVYIGFGLRDPDFIYVRDLLANTYKGGTRDHYAIMAEVTNEESDYWRRNYGIHLVTYPAPADANGRRDHTGLLILLDQLGASNRAEPSATTPASDETLGPDAVLALARHAARLSRATKAVPELPIRVQTNADARGHYRMHHHDPFDQALVNTFLDEGPERAILVGLPGAGKTYALQQAAARAASRLHDACLAEPFNYSVIVPVLADLKLYRGNLENLIDQTLPPNLPFKQLSRQFKLRVYLDSFNEMPREYWETASYEDDFSEFCTTAEGVSLVIGSRTDDGLAKLGLAAYSLDKINDERVSIELARLGINIEGRFDTEFRQLLQKPFYFQLITSGAATLQADARPRDLYQSYFSNLSRAFLSRFGRSLNVETALSLGAYDAINRGEEAYPLSDLLRSLQASIEANGDADLSARDVANWLVSTSTLIPHIGSRIAFVHQSITEYLAASELARRYLDTPKILQAKLALRRWDQALFLALSLLPPANAERFFEDVVNVDFELALDAAKYLESGRDEVVSRLMALIPERCKALDIHRIGWIVEQSLPVTSVHEPQLRSLMKLGDSLGGAAAKRLLEIRGPQVKQELLSELLVKSSDYNYCCNGIGPALKDLANLEDIQTILAMADTLSAEVTHDCDDETAHGFICGAAAFLSGLDVSIVGKCFLLADRRAPVSEIRARILCHLLWENETTEGLELAAELLLRGVDRASTSIYFITSGARNEPAELSWASFTESHVDRLIYLAEHANVDHWPLRALIPICAARADLSAAVVAHASQQTGLTRALLLHCAAPGDQAQIFSALGEIARMDASARNREPVHLLNQIEIDWSGHESLLLELLRLRDAKLASAVIDNMHAVHDPRLNLPDIGDVSWWLEWMSELGDDEDILIERLSDLFATHLSKDMQRKFIEEFNRSTSMHRRVLSRSVLSRMDDVSTDDFGADAVSFLLASLNHETLHSWHGHLLGHTATEQFVVERLLPLLQDANARLSTNLQNVLRKAGARHGRRYVHH